MVKSEISANTSSSGKSTPSKVACEICGLLFDTEDMKEEHKKLEHIEHKMPSGVS